MKKSVFILLLCLICTGVMQAQTYISSDITTNTTWDMAGSPYIIDVFRVNVDSTATLTIEPGVEVQFPQHRYLHVYGSLYAIGTATDSIIIGSTATNSAGSINYYGETRVDYVSFNRMVNTLQSNEIFSPNTLNANLEMNHCLVKGCNTGLYGNKGTQHVQVDSSAFIANRTAIRSAERYHIRNSIFQNNTTRGIMTMENSLVENCTFQGHPGIALDTYMPFTVKNCDFQQNATALRLSYFTLKSAWISVPSEASENQIGANDVGIEIASNSSAMTLLPLIEHNEICNNLTNLYHNGGNANVLDISNNCWCEWDSLAIMPSINNPANRSFMLLPLDSTCLPSMVFPGDANHDQICNNADILPIGVHFNQTGPARANASLNWAGQPAADWATNQANGRNVKHADCDGDSTVNWSDTLAINLNYGSTHNSWRGAASGAGTTIRFSMPTVGISPGDTISIPITLGTFDTLAVGVYGLAFSIQYDMMLIDSASVRVSYANSWLGTKNSDMLTIDKDFYSLGQVDIGMVRNDKMNRTDYGTIADLIVVINDDLSKRELPFILSFGNIQAIDSAGNTLDINGEAGEATIDTGTNTGIANGLQNALKLYPNPIQDVLILQHPDDVFESVNLISLIGQKAQLWEGKAKGELRLDLSEYPAGIYILEVKMREASACLKIELR